MATDAPPAAAPARPKTKLVGYKNFVRSNPMTDKFRLQRFHHIEFWCGDATNTFSRFAVGLGMQLVAKSDLSTGNPSYCSYVLKSNDLMFVFSAPYASSTDPVAQRELRNAQPHPGVTGAAMRDFCDKHGFGVRAVGVLVDDAEVAYEQSVANGARGVLPPHILTDDAAVTTSTSAASDGGSGGEGYYQKMSEVELYGDVVLRYVSHHHAGGAASGGTAAVDGGGNVRSESVFLPRYEVRLYKFANPVHPLYRYAEDVPLDAGDDFNGGKAGPLTYGLQRLDHAVGNVENLLETVDYITGFTGMHQFAEFTAEDVGTVDSGLNSMVLANNNEMVLLPVNEPTFGTKRKSQIQTYLEQNNGPGLQHLALKSDDIFATVRAMRAHGGGRGGFEFQKPASADYYRALPSRVGTDALTPAQFAEVQELGLLVDRDDQGVLVQIFTKPLGDRPTVFIEVIQRIGCMREMKKEEKDVGGELETSLGVTSAEGDVGGRGTAGGDGGERMEQAAGCGGFGKGNFSELFKSIEQYEMTLKV